MSSKKSPQRHRGIVTDSTSQAHSLLFPVQKEEFLFTFLENCATVIADPLLESLGKHIFPSDENTASLVYTSLSRKRFCPGDFLLKISPPNIYILYIIKHLALWLKCSKYISFHGHIISAQHPVRRPKNFIVKQSTTQRSGRISEQSAAAEVQPTAEPDTFTCSM